MKSKRGRKKKIERLKLKIKSDWQDKTRQDNEKRREEKRTERGGEGGEEMGVGRKGNYIDSSAVFSSPRDEQTKKKYDIDESVDWLTSTCATHHILHLHL